MDATSAMAGRSAHACAALVARGRRCVRAGVAFALVSAAGCAIQERTDRDTAATSAPSDSATSEFITAWGESGRLQAVRSGELIWIWGMPGTVPRATPPQLVEGGAAAETRQALENVEEVLAVAGAQLRDVAQCSMFLAETADVAAATEAYLEYFASPPARTAVVTGGFALGARVELECTAVVSDGA